MIGLYIHIPFCRKKCAYCDFYSVTDTRPMQAYVDALCREMDAYRGRYAVDTIFVGGGTPSMLSFNAWSAIGEAIRRNFYLAPSYEFTVECNPESYSGALAEVLREIGVNRLSIGVQSMDGDVLKAAGRIHSSMEAMFALVSASQYFDNVNADLIIGLPLQTEETVKRDIEMISGITKHMSIYALQVEEGTPLYDAVEEQSVRLPDDDTVAEMYDIAYKYLLKQGYHRYEISNFARDGYECRHNLNCWRFHDYIGIGAAAHGYLDGVRYYHYPDVEAYIDDPIYRAIEEEDDLANRKFEMIMLGLRTEEGLDIEAYNRLFNSDFRTEFADVLRSALIRGATRFTDTHFYVRPEYLYISNTVSVKFMDKMLNTPDF